MPIGSFAILPDVINELIKVKPKTILDLGCGFGIYGVAVREWLELGYNENGWNIYIEGVEAFQKYRNPNWEHYDKIIVGDILKVNFDRKYDAILLLDVIEHFEKEIGRKLIEQIKKLLNPGGILLVGTTAIFCKQDAVYGNEFERHRSLWTIDDFKDFEIIKDGKMDKYGHYMLLTKYIKR
ncbi:MAG TPA: methyltransferase domain-containing protein [Sedimentibacter sp.]|nr:methyltransferase domain-containing protein [Sedimentibacter sp.]